MNTKTQATEEKIPEPQSQQQQANAHYQPKPPKSGFGLSLVAIAMVLALGGGGYYIAQQKSLELQTKIDALNTQISSLSNELQQARADHSDVANQAKTAQAERSKLQVLLTQQDNNLTSLQNALIELKGRRPNDWLLADADHLIKQAGRQLWIEKDVATATRLVETADQRIAELNNPTLTPIRQALAADIQTLKAIPRIDTDGIVIRIDSLQQKVNALPLANAILAQVEEEKAKPVVSTEINDWKENLLTSLKDFGSHFITYREREGSAIPLLTPAQTYYIQENIKAKLAQAINSVHSENTELYVSSLNTVQNWVKEYYNLEMPETKSFLASLDELKAQTIKVEYPQSLTSLALISDELTKTLSRDLTTTVSNKGEQQ